VYHGPSIVGDRALTRVRGMFATYEAVFYAVYRTAVLRDVFRRVAEVETFLARELLTAGLTAAAGDVVRVPALYYGRSTEPSISTAYWHPHQILVKSPAVLFDEYRRVRSVLVDEIAGRDGDIAVADLSGLVDLVFLRYLGPFLRSDVLDMVLDDRMKGLTPDATIEHLWDVFVRPAPRVNRVSRLMERFMRRYAPAHVRAGDIPRDYTLDARTATGAPRTYTLFHEFLFPSLKPPPLLDREAVLSLLEELNAY
jgi:hypothetical protein